MRLVTNGLCKMLMLERFKAKRVIFEVNRLYFLKVIKSPTREINGKTSPEGPKNETLLQKVSKALNTVPSIVQKKGEDLTKASLDKISGSISAFDDLLGITEVREAQAKVREAEKQFMDFRKKVQQSEKELELVRAHLNDVRKRLDRVSRDDDRYLTLATEEHKTLLEEKRLKAFYAEQESQERDHFALLSGIVRESHEKERQRAERTKHWSVIGSLIGATIGVISSSLINYLRLKEVKSSVRGTGEELMEKTSELLNILSSQDSKILSNTKELKEVFAEQSKIVTNKLDNVKDAIDTYALSVSIDSDVGTIEAGISLKTLTSQLRELVQLQLASEQERIERQAEPSDLANDNLTKMIEKLTFEIQNLNKEVDSKLGNSQSLKNKHEDDIFGDSVKEEHRTYMDRVEYWAKAQTIASVATVIASILILIYEISK